MMSWSTHTLFTSLKGYLTVHVVYDAFSDCSTLVNLKWMEEWMDTNHFLAVWKDASSLILLVVVHCYLKDCS